ncbi:DUF805 domain-containing protein [Rhodohalobacter mucosus]|uniref:DUF805 domain-containing protein n=1 Tax=Rhodohalobacter mucosus TaxID=2079485 RepID=A0A316TYV5_9BACT|nr:DUF805 domain-containing protein [Rhodohalobacter mucosus]PWN08024.1 hypothetical protein DDZ15_03150 [Rhodohalobacter mucosus]
MNKLLNQIFGFQEPVDQKFYFTVGLSLMLGKYLVDMFVIYMVAGIFWTPIDYLIPLLEVRADKISEFPLWFYFTFIIWTLPFIWVGVSMTYRRAIDAGKSPWYVLGFFLPVLNYLVMLWLCIQPSKPIQTGKTDQKNTSSEDRFKHALIGVIASIIAGIAVILIAVFIFDSYGLSVFVLVPFLIGLIATYLFNAKGIRSLKESNWVAFIALGILSGSVILFSLEGLICVAMALPLAIPIVFLGAVLGRKIATNRVSYLQGGLPILILFPAFLAFDSISPQSSTFSVTTSVEISADINKVWDNVIEFNEIEQDPEWFFKLGIAYPVRATIEGQGVGAIRYCEFSTGPFVEPITVWNEPVHLAFDVIEQPASLQELSFYDNVNAPHIHDFFRSTNGEFRLTSVDNNKTLLEGTTWYKMEIYPHFYWRPISEWLVGKIHERVLKQIAFQSENPWHNNAN